MTKTDTTQTHSEESNDATKLRFASVLKTQLQVLGSYTKLEDAIRNAVKLDPGHLIDAKGRVRSVDRRKLKAIVEGHKRFSLTLDELLALDKYLEPLGHGLAYNPILLKPDLMDRLAQSGKTTFLLGSKPDAADPFRINISHWDFLGFNSIQEKVLGASDKSVLIDIREVRMPRKEDKVNNKSRAEEYLRNEKAMLAFDEDGPSVVCLASSRSNLMAEIMLCLMFGRDGFTSTPPAGLPELPFQFVWSGRSDYVFPSQFNLGPHKAGEEDPKFGEALVERGVSGLRVNRKFKVDELTDKDESEGYTYAVCAAQRRANKQVWLLVAGLTGPATYAASRWVHNMATKFDDATPGQPSKVYWSVVRVHTVKPNEDNHRTYQVGDAEFVTSGSF